jgi:hypothetical protein
VHVQSRPIFRRMGFSARTVEANGTHKVEKFWGCVNFPGGSGQNRLTSERNWSRS